MNTALTALETLFLALADKTRLKIIALLADGPVAVGLLVDLLGDSQPKVSRHLAYMRRAGIVSTERNGKSISYALRQPADPAARLVFDALISSIAVVKVGGRYEFISQTPAEFDAMIADAEQRFGVPTPDPEDPATVQAWMDRWERSEGDDDPGDVEVWDARSNSMDKVTSDEELWDATSDEPYSDRATDHEGSWDADSDEPREPENLDVFLL